MLESVSPNQESNSRLAYSRGILARGETRTLFIAGQVGIDSAGMVSPLFETQVRQAWTNLLAALAAANMVVCDLAKVTVYLTKQSDYATYAALRGEFLGAHRPASSLVVAAALARLEWSFKIEAIAVATV
jgi:2-iminobutanoate/2-iminopropanoate deaminase